jgi:hypothetical protein
MRLRPSKKSGGRNVVSSVLILILTKEGEKVNLSVPQHKELAPGTLRKLISYAGISVDDFLKLL